ncbi:MAG: hypothetical protein JST54_32175 [Deltaproteobacteria bacterium]|nr:hypothetical protein [Deltaproteobacteria bacterium]
MSSNNKARGVTIDQLLAAILNGVNTSFPSGSSLAIDGVTYDKAGLGQKIQEVISPYITVEELATQHTNAVKARAAAEAGAKDFTDKLVKGIEYLVNSDPNSLSKFGISLPKTKRKLTAQEKFERAAKAKATRAMRGTRGPRQLEDVKAKGDVSVSVTLTPQPGTPAPGSSVAPSGPGSSTGSNSSTPAAPSLGQATPTGPAAAPNGATGPQEVNGAAH